jgi:hypothetical protein
MDRVFMGPAVAFPDGSTLMPTSGNGAVLMDASAMVLPEATQVNGDAAPQEADTSKVSGIKSDKIPRPPNAFILYRKDHHESVKVAHPGIHNNKICKSRLSSFLR